MTALLVRLAILAGGLGLVESGLADGLARGSALGWLMLGVGFVLLVAGTVGFMRPLIEGREKEAPR